MSAAILSGLVTALLSILGKLATSAFFEAVLSKVIVWSLEQVAPKTTNTLDDELVTEVKKRLGHE